MSSGFGFFITSLLVLFGLGFFATLIAALVKPSILSEVEIGPVTLSGELGVRIGSGIILGIFTISALCYCLANIRLPQLQLPRFRSRNQQNSVELASL